MSSIKPVSPFSAEPTDTSREILSSYRNIVRVGGSLEKIAGLGLIDGQGKHPSPMESKSSEALDYPEGEACCPELMTGDLCNRRG